MKGLLTTIIIASMVAVLTIAAAPRTAAPRSSLELAIAAAAVAQANAVAAPLYEAEANRMAKSADSFPQGLRVLEVKSAVEISRRGREAREAAMKYAEESRVLYERARLED